ncbi:MAG: hypothetical protein E5V92_11595 [Mesorhizobium sp.]|nr:MAG: hypothetical protein E5V92_11595 [Mesorhizobium sp.]
MKWFAWRSEGRIVQSKTPASPSPGYFLAPALDKAVTASKLERTTISSHLRHSSPVDPDLT